MLLADLTDVTNPIGIATDWRVVLHEVAGHGILYEAVNGQTSASRTVQEIVLLSF